MADTRLETLSIQINASIGNADKNIRKITASVERLEDCINKTDWEQFNAMERHLRNIASIDFTQVASSLHDVVDAFRALGLSKTTMSFVRDNQLLPKMEDTAPKDVKEPDWSIDFSKLMPSKNFEDIEKSLGNIEWQIGDVSNATDLWAKKLYEVGLSTKQVETALNSLKTPKEEEINVKELKNAMKELGFTSEQTRKVMEDLGVGAGKTSKNFKRLLKQMGRIAFYRLVRRAIQMITQALKEGIDNLVQYDKDLDDAISGMKNSLGAFKNSIAGAFAGVLELIQPAFSFIVDGLTDMNNALAEFNAMLSGKSTFLKAKKQADSYAESLKKAKNASLGIDELNVIQKNQQGDLFEETEVDGGVLTSLKAIGAVLATILTTATALSLIVVALKGGSLLTALTSIGGILMTIGGTIFTITSMIDIFKEGINLENTIALVAGLALVVGGLSLKFKALGLAIGSIIVAVASLVIGFKEFINGWNDMGTWQKIIGILGLVFGLIMAIGTAIALATGNYLKAGILATFTLAGVATAIGVSKQAQAGVSFATGGFPEDGIFFANHNELVGQFSNGKTAVANNEEITAGIYQAVLQAMQDSGSTGNRDIVVAIDGREVARAVNKQNATQGANVFKGGNFYGSR